MTDRSRRRSSKWDTKEGLPPSPENSRDRNKLAAWDGIGGGSRRMSPGLTDWRRQNRGQSPREKWDRPVRNRSRSRSRSPIRGFRQESANYDRNRNRSQALCRDFGAGRCRRGSDCPFVHQGDRNYDDSWEDRHRKGGISKYPTANDATTDYPPRNSGEYERERNRANNDTLCKYFLAGNCRSGKNCRFSHGKTSESPERKMDEADKYWEEPRWRGSGPPPDAGKFEDGNGRRGALDERVNDRRDLGFEKESRAWNDTATGASSVIPPVSRSSEKVLADADMSPDWNYSLKTTNHAKDDSHHSIYSSPVPTPVLPIHGQDGAWNSSGQINHSPTVNKDMRFDTPGISQSNLNFSSNVMHIQQGFDQNHQNSSAVALPILNPIGQANMVIPFDPQSEGVALNQPNIGISLEGKLAENPNTSQIIGVPPSNDSVTGEQLTEVTNISATIAQLLEAGKQLPQLYASLSTTQPPPEGPFDQVKPVVSSVSTVLQEQCEHLPDSAEQKKVGTIDGFKRGGEQAVVSNNGSSNQTVPFESCDGKDYPDQEANNGSKVDESKDVKNEDQTEKEDVGGVKKDEDGKKNKEAKSVRAFKFALAEFAKELLKPTWKDGRVGKEAYKTIVKKVVDKVTGSLQGANIPQSQEKIEQYLSASKPKLTKLVQAYVEKFQKSNK